LESLHFANTTAAAIIKRAMDALFNFFHQTVPLSNLHDSKAEVIDLTDSPEDEFTDKCISQFSTVIIGDSYYTGPLVPGVQVYLVRDSITMLFDDNSIRVDDQLNQSVGYLPIQIASWLAPLMDNANVHLEARYSKELTQRAIESRNFSITIKLFLRVKADNKKRWVEDAQKLGIPFNYINEEPPHSNKRKKVTCLDGGLSDESSSDCYQEDGGWSSVTKLDREIENLQQQLHSMKAKEILLETKN